VSIWTASNTFSNPDRVAEATRQRVLDAADALDYAGPNPGARSLALGRTGMVALISPGDASLLLSDPAAALVAQGLLTTCDRAGLSLVFCGQEGTQLVDARVVVRGSVNAEVRGPVVVVDGEAPGDTPQVRAEAGRAARDIARHLVELGHRTIALIASDIDGVRLAAATEALADIDHLAVYRSPGTPWPTAADGEAAARAAFAHRPRPTALLAVSDTLAFGALEAAHRMGMRVPRDVSISGIDDLPGSDARGLTTALVPYRPMGELAGQALVERLDGRPAPALPVLPVPLVPRATTGPPPKRR
jgi:DNA-binding LacI/PurR family transcriptional regulator